MPSVSAGSEGFLSNLKASLKHWPAAPAPGAPNWKPAAGAPKSNGAAPPPGSQQLAIRDALSLGLTMCIIILPIVLFRTQVFGFMSRLFEQERALEDGVLIASLLDEGRPKVGAMYWVHDDGAYNASPPRSKKWYHGTIVESCEGYFGVLIDDAAALPLDGSLEMRTTVT